MMKRLWMKGALLIATGTVFQMITGGCLNAVAQRILVAALFD